MTATSMIRSDPRRRGVGWALVFLAWVFAPGLVAATALAADEADEAEQVERTQEVQEGEELVCEGEGVEGVFVVVRSLRSAKGLVTVELYNDDPEGFIKKAGRLERRRVEAADGETKVCFNIPKPGTYAVAIYHDENGNKKFDKNFLGIPTEGFGFSNNPKIYFGPPDHDEAAFEVGAEPVTVHIDVTYL